MQENEIINRILTLCQSRQWSVYRLAKESGIAYSTLCTMLHKGNTPSIGTLIRICNGFGISIGDFFDEENPRSTLSESETRCLSVWNALTRESKDQSLRYMELLLRDQNRAEQ